MIFLIRTTAGLLCVMALSACSLLSNKNETLTVYAPRLAQTTAADGVELPWQLLVQMPVTIGPLDGARIVVMPQPGVVEFYKGARWRDRAPVMVQELLLQSFQDSKRLLGVGAPASGLRGDYALHMDLRDFQAEYRGAVPVVVIRLNAQLLDQRSNRVLAARTFNIEQACRNASVNAVAGAFEQGLNTVVLQIVEWSIAGGEANWSAIAH